MIKNIIIALLLCTCGLLYAQNRAQERRHSEEIADVIQNTSDDLLAVCEEKITHLEDNCADMIEDAVQEVLEQF